MQSSNLRIARQMDDLDLKDSAVQTLGFAVGITAQIVMDEEPVPFQDWPFTQQMQARDAARVAVRWNQARMREHCRLHARIALAMTKYSRRYQDLHPIQQNAINREADTVINVFCGRMLDYNFAFLGGDVVRELSPERYRGGVQ